MLRSRSWWPRTGVLVLLVAGLLVAVFATGWRPFQAPSCVHEGGPPADPVASVEAVEARMGARDAFARVGWDAFRDLDDLPMLSVGSQPRMFSSADAAGGNADGFTGSYLCRDDDQYVLGEHVGPGELTSLWFTRDEGNVVRNGRLRIELDGEPVVNARLQDVVDGRLGTPFVPPLVSNADQTSGGVTIQVPMPFRESMRVSTDAPPRFYRVQYRVFGDAAGVDTFDPSDPAADVVKTLRAAGRSDPKPSHPDDRTAEQSVGLGPGETSSTIQLPGPGVIAAMRLRLPDVPFLPQPGDPPALAGSRETVLDLDPDNSGVRIIRRMRSREAVQVAQVTVDGETEPQSFGRPAPAPGGTLEQVLELPGALVSGHEQLRLTDVHAGPASLEVQSFVRGAWVDTDREQLEAPPPRSPADEQSARRVQDLRLRISFDGRRTVDAPVGEFFGVGLGPRQVKTLLFGVDPEEGYQAWWPMPFARGARVELYNGSEDAVVEADLEVVWRPEARWEQALGPDGTAGYFHAFADEGPVVPGQDWILARARGHGRVVGFAQTMTGHEPGRLYLEGDERVFIDGAQSPQLHGTGTEDLYLAGWYFNRGPFTTPFVGHSANLERTPGCPQECDAVYRVLLADAFPFHADLTFGIEHGPENRHPGDYGSTTFWYGRDDPALQPTDALDVGEPDSERSHGYEDEAGALHGMEAIYDGVTEPEPVADRFREGHGEIRFHLAVDPDNDGVLLRRRADQLRPGQTARVLVDGEPVGVWYRASGNATRRWVDDDMFLPPRVTEDRERIEVTLQPLDDAPPWTAARYEAFALRAPAS